MKKIVLCAVLATAAVTPLTVSAAGTQTFCNGGAAAASTVSATASTSDFVKVSFTPKCSANVYLVGNDASSTLYKVGSASGKGKSKFAGSSDGGAVSGSNCSDDGAACELSNATAAAGGTAE
ncbi:MAG TPA: hypothetical protein PKY22_04960 [Accumulibacter sp.]|nr:hypothetical protein [Accumulibacter sp.]